MQALETTIPWWRKALNFALDGIRSGFGLFSRSPRTEDVAEPTSSNRLEETQEKETTLIDPSPKPESVAAAPAIPVEPVTVAESAAAAEAALETTPEPAEAAEAEAVIEPDPEPAEETEPEPEAAPESAELQETETMNKPDPEPVEETETEAEPEPKPESLIAEIIETEVATEALPEPVESTEPVVEAEQESIDISETETMNEPDPEPFEEPEAEPETVESPAAEPVSEALPEAVESVEPVVDAEPSHTSEPAADAPVQLSLSTGPTADEKAAAKQAAIQKKRDESSAESPFSVVVGQVYDGPLDLLLDLIRKQDIDIYDIPIAKITAQFLAYVNQLKAGDVDVAGEFIYTASLLIHIKSRMLLPRASSGPEDEAEDPRRELVERLLEHERFKNAAQMLQQKQMLEAATWSNPGSREFKDDAAAEPEIAADTVDLVRVFSDILERARKRPVLDVTEDSVTVGQMIQFLARRLTMEDKPIALRRLLSHTHSERALVAMFLALLELVRLQAILLRQDRAFSEIFIKKHTDFDALMNDGLANAHDDWR
jgi:segregation and condensation protein A